MRYFSTDAALGQRFYELSCCKDVVSISGNRHPCSDLASDSRSTSDLAQLRPIISGRHTGTPAPSKCMISCIFHFLLHCCWALPPPCW